MILKKYRFGFDIWGLMLFAIVMLPNIIWFVKPAPNDILRGESVTGLVDTIASVCQILFVGIMCVVRNTSVPKVKLSPFIYVTMIFVILYLAGWGIYYTGNTSAFTVLLLTVPPCMAFIFYLLDRKNILALIPAGVFACCHLIYAAVNFIV